MSEQSIKFPDITVPMVGEDGNAFAILARVQREMRRSGVGKSDCDAFFAEATAGDYDGLIQTVMRWVTVA